MNSERNYPAAVISDKCRKRISSGHPWIYDNEIVSLDGTPEDGSLVDILTEKNRFVGTGFYNSASKIRVRIISRNANDVFDDTFWRRRVKYAYDYRKTVMAPEELSCCRLIFGEADFFPGLTVDRFSELLSVQILSLGIEKNKDVILHALLDVLNEDGQYINGIFLRNDVKIRTLEGMEEEKGWYWYRGETPPSAMTRITENGIIYNVDVENGQKTGFFLDQKRNRAAAASIAAGRNVMDCCTHTGSFALNAAKGGAAHVTAVDVSASAIANARANAELNGLSDRISFETADVFEFLQSRIEAHDRSYDYIILDPPAFTKSRKTVGNAKNGYLELNTLAMRLLPRGGYLATCSCSHFMTEQLFREMLDNAAHAAGVSLRQIEFRQQCADHPILSCAEETNYLKFFLFQIV
ncbi:MAG: class I SAM-dependent rRNA methyltransferase [Oscillospiraceae bacterium]|nr:class I SAM-dependent rRNA methyltransferase [Oscillospiraceae bacterium]